MKRFLLADDSATNRKKVRGLLQDRGYEALEAVDGLQALRLFQSEKPDCVITDLNMPTMGGVQLVKAMRDCDTTIPVIVLTRDHEEDTRDECIKAGAAAVLYKPLQMESLRYMLDQASLAPH